MPGIHNVGLCLIARLCPTLCNPMDCSLPGSSVHRDSPDKNTGVSCHALLQGIFPTQQLNPGLPHGRQILCQLSHKGSPRIQGWIAYPFSSRSSWPRIEAESRTLQADSLPTELSGNWDSFNFFFSPVLFGEQDCLAGPQSVTPCHVFIAESTGGGSLLHFKEGCSLSLFYLWFFIGA